VRDPTTPHPDEDDLDVLPPLDGEERDERDAPEPEPDFGDLLEDEPGGDASLDDATAEHDPPDASELEVDDGESGWLEEPPDAPELDLGDVSIVDFGEGPSEMGEADEPPAPEEDEELAAGTSPEHGDLDTGDEGPLGGDEELREADLPELDADDEGELDDAALVDAGFASDEPVGVPWAAEPWPRVGAPVGLSVATAVACAGPGALVAGRAEGGVAELVRVDLEGTTQTLATAGVDPADVRALAVDGPRVAALVEDGRALLSSDGGVTFLAVAPGVPAAELALASGTLWLRTRGQGLVAVREGPHARPRADPDTGAPHARPRADPDTGAPHVERCAVPGAVAAIARDVGGVIAGLVVDDAGRATALVRAYAGGAIRREPVDAPEPRLPAALAVRGVRAAYAARRGGVVRRSSAGAWESHEWEGRVTAIAFVDDAGTLVATTYSDADDTTALVRLDAQGVASVVARIGPSRSEAESDGRVVALAHDDARGVVWVAGGFGLAAFAVR
jgi:hypothetical protein